MRRTPPITVCEMKAVVELANTSRQPATRPGMLSGTMTVNSVRQREAPRAAEASRRLGSSRDITLISGSSISGISIWVSEITSPSSVCSRRSGSEMMPSDSSTWFTMPSRPSTTIQAKVRTTTDSRSLPSPRSGEVAPLYGDGGVMRPEVTLMTPPSASRTPPLRGIREGEEKKSFCHFLVELLDPGGAQRIDLGPVVLDVLGHLVEALHRQVGRQRDVLVDRKEIVRRLGERFLDFLADHQVEVLVGVRHLGRALGDVHRGVEGDGAALGLHELDVDALALQRRDRLGVGVHHVALALLEQARHGGRQADGGDLGQHLLELDQGRFDVGQRAAELLGDLDQRGRTERRLEAG